MIILVADELRECAIWCQNHKIRPSQTFAFLPNRAYRLYGYRITEVDDIVLLTSNCEERMIDLLVERGWDGIPSDRFVNQ